MKKNFLFILAFLLSSAGVYANTGNAIESFKNLEYEMIFESDNIFLEGDNREIIQAGQKANLYNSIRLSITEKRLEAQQKKEDIEDRIFSLEKSVGELEREIIETNKIIIKTNDAIIEATGKIKAAENIIELMLDKVAKSEENLQKYITHIYAESNSLYDGGEIDNIKAILLNGEDIGELLSEKHYKTLIQITGKKLLDKHRTYLRELYIKKIGLEKDKKNLSILRKNQVIAKKTLDEKVELKEKIIEISKGEQAVYEEYIRDKIAVEKDLKEKQLQEELKFDEIKDRILGEYQCDYVDVNTKPDAEDFLSDRCFDLNRAIYAESKLKDEEFSGNVFFDWPVPPTNGISAFFNDENYIKFLGTDHGALDIPVNQGTDIVAPADGYVIFVLAPTTEEYSYVALKHSNGFVSVYGHVNEILVEKYDFIKRGEVFAKSGGEPGTKGAGYLSTGPHLHFEVFYEQVMSDPMQFLDLSFLSINNIPEKHVYKFYGDFQARKGYEYDGDPRDGKVFKLSGTNEIERQKDLLNKYASPEFRNWDTWVEESIDGGIDPTFIMCIGLAETGLGRNMKTPFNVGNVGNTDSGATLTFDSARTGIYVMVKGLNNKYLSQYDTINLLSRYGNKDESKPIYASSPDHWHNNIIKCMSAIKGQFVPDTYPFRLK